MKTFSLTDTGTLREMNQDFYFASEQPLGNLPNLFLVADGMGGHKAGDYASRFTVERMVASVSGNTQEEPVRILEQAVAKANEILLAEAMEDFDKNGMGTTLVGASIFNDRLIAFNIGDSRLYIVGQDIRQVTRDHSLVEEMIRMGELTPEEARLHPRKNIITRAVGATEEVEADFFEEKLVPGDYVLLCTDGLTNMVPDKDILRIIREEATLEDKGRMLVRAANANGGRDNITVMLIDPLSEE